MTEATLTLRKFKVKLAGFRYTAHEGPDGVRHLHPIHREGQETQAIVANAYVVEAMDPLHAEAVFKKKMGISKTDRDFKVEELPDETPEGSVELEEDVDPESMGKRAAARDAVKVKAAKKRAAKKKKAAAAKKKASSKRGKK